jgi:DNA-binding transcriptional LysR family regulator
MMACMDWDDVRVFAAVLRARNLGAGASAAGVDRSTASRRIASLERALKTKLFLRTRDGLQPSAAGERLLAHAERMAAEAQALEASASESGSEVSGRVRLATTETLAAMLVRQGLLDLCRRYPALELELLGENRVVDLTRGEADLALRVTTAKEPSLRVRRVARLGFAAFADEAYTRTRGRPRSEHELAGHDVLVHAGELARLPEAKWLTTRPGVRVVLRTSSMTALLAAVSAGAGIAVISGSWMERQFGLIRLFDIDALAPRSLWLVSHPDASARSAVRVTADHIAALLAAQSSKSRARRA